MNTDPGPKPIPIPDHYDICIVGAGAVGYAMAYQLRNSGKKVIVLESGINNEKWKKTKEDDRRYWDPTVNQLDAGVLVPGSFLDKVKKAAKEPRDFYTESRDRCLGGSTNCWGGWIRPLDDYDFRTWPLSADDIAKLKSTYYPEALKLIGLDHFELFDKPEEWINQNLMKGTVKTFSKEILDKYQMKTVVIQQQQNDKMRDFQESPIFQDLFTSAHPNLKLRPNANATKLDYYFDSKTNKWNVSGLVFQELKSATEPGDQYRVTADQYVLAMGGLEIPRFILANAPGSQWFGKDSEVGQFYMNHPKYISVARGWAKNPMPDELNDLVRGFFGGVERRSNPDAKIFIYLVPTESGMKDFRTKNFRVALDWKYYDSDSWELDIELNFEQVPYRQSAVKVHWNELEELLKQPKIELDWRFTAQDADTVNGAIAMVKKLFEDGFKVEFFDWSSVDWKHDKGAYPPEKDITDTPIYTGDHHIGTCAMRGGGYVGVVDSNCKFVGGSNLWACSTGVFTTGGWANSTFTLLALALRLADRLASG
jgi:hypothetical protein